MNIFGKKVEPVKAAPKMERLIFKQSEGFRGYKALRVDRFGCEGNNILLYDAFKRSKGKNALPEGEPYPATIDLFPYINENNKLVFQVVVDKHLLGFVSDQAAVQDFASGRIDAVYLKAEEEPGKHLKMFVRYK